MKKLICLLVLCYCLSGMCLITPVQTQVAHAAERTALVSAQSAAKPVVTAKKSKKSKKKKAKEYSYKIGKKAPILLSQIFEDLGLKATVDSVKEIKPASKAVKKRVSCVPSEEHKGDYEIDVLKDFKEARLNIKTRKSSFVLVLKKGVKTDKKKEQTKANTAEEEPAKDDGKKQEAAEEKQEPAEVKQEIAEQKQEPVGKKKETVGGQKQSDDVKDEPAKAEEKTAAEKQETDGEKQETVEGQQQPDAVKEEPAKTEEKAAGKQQGSADGPQDSADETQDSADGSQGSADGPQGSADGPQESADGPQDSTDGPQDSADETQDSADETQDPADETQDPADETQDSADETQETGDASGDTVDEGQNDTEDAPQGGSGEQTRDTTSQAPVELPEDAEAWFERDGVKLGGTLKETLAMLEGDEKIYIRTPKTVLVKKAPLKPLSNATLLPDEDVFKGDYVVNLSLDDPDTTSDPALIDPKDLKDMGDKADLYIWVAAKPTEPDDGEDQKQEPPEGDDDPKQEEEEEKPTIAVSAKNYTEATWTNGAPEFTLSGIPDGKDDWSYAAIVFDERIIPLSEGRYVPEEEGRYSLRFVIVDGIGDILSASEQFTLWLDWTAPDMSVEVDDDRSYTLYVSAEDELSGVEAVSLDGGKKWHDMSEDEDYTYKGKKKKKFRAGTIQVRDAAGNIAESQESYTVDKADNGGSGFGGGGGGGGGGEAKKARSHARGDGEEGAEYDALELELPPEPMDQLTVGGELMDLTLVLGAAQEPEAPVGEKQAFTASLYRWDAAEQGQADDDAQPDTLLLTAELDPNLGDQFTYDWRFNGEVYRELANSGIRYVALQVGDEVAAFPTEGFTGGTKFTELKMLGVSTRKFDYTLSMKVNMDPGYVSAMSDSDYSQACDLAIHTVVENMAYELSSSTNSIMYFYDVYVGPEDMLEQPFGEYRAN